MTFCIQNYNTPNAGGAYGINSGADANMLGYGAYLLANQDPVLNSVAIKFDASGANAALASNNAPSSTGLYMNGGPAASLLPQLDLTSSGVNLHAGHVMAAHVVYDGTLLTMTLRDTVTNAQYRTSWPINIPAVTGGNMAWIGFTAGTIPVSSADVLTWSFSRGYAQRLPAPTFSVAAGSYTSTQSIALTAYPGSTIYYTTNGQAPTTGSHVYAGPITVSANEIVQAIAVEPGYTDSLVSLANYQIAPTGTPVINFSSGFSGASNLITLNGGAILNGATLQMTDANLMHEGSTAWYSAPVSVKSFTTHFTMQFPGTNASGMTFAIQNQQPTTTPATSRWISGGPNAIANSGAGMGYSGNTGTGGQAIGLENSVAVKFDLSTNTTGVYFDGADLSQNGTSLGSINLKSGHPINVTLTYDGSTLNVAATDSTTGATFAHSWSIDIPGTVGASTAYVGFTGGSEWYAGTQNVTSWTYGD